MKTDTSMIMAVRFRIEHYENQVALLQQYIAADKEWLERLENEEVESTIN